jgi:hypothetical protein
MATATYSGSASQKVANGYVTTVTYSGEIVSSGIEAVVYTLTYVGEPIPIPAAAWADILRYIAYALLLLLLLAGIAFAVMTCCLTQRFIR